MPKVKTKSGAAKRFRTQGGGGIKRSRAFLRHPSPRRAQAQAPSARDDARAQF
jgi:ribosomal protein L35